MRIGSGSKLEQQGSVKAHSQGASQACFLRSLPHPYWLVTGGNDGQVTLWDLSRHPVVSPETTTKPHGGGRRGKIKAKRKVQDASKNPSEAGAERQEAEEEGGPTAEEEEQQQLLGPKLSISHGDKINWLCPAVLNGEPSVVVADQSSRLTIYPLTL